MSNANKLLSGVVSLATVGLTALLLLPSRQSIELVSPDGVYRLTLSATNDGAMIVLQGSDAGEITVSTLTNGPPSVTMDGAGGSVFQTPHIVLRNDRETRLITVPSR